ncbi:MAG: hypothetical protein R3E66_11585 [bacterium]
MPEIGALWMSLGWNRGLQAHYDVAFAHFLTAELVFERANDTHWIANLARARAFLNLQRANTESARADVTRAIELSRLNGNRNGLAGGYMYLGEIDRHAQDYASARSHYLAAYDLYRQNPANRWIAECNLALCEIGAGNITAADRVLQRLVASSQYQRKLFAPFQLALAYSDAHHGDWETYDNRFKEVLMEVKRLKHMEYDIAWLFDRLGDLSERADHRERARQAYTAALTIWEGLGRKAEANLTRFAIARLNS